MMFVKANRYYAPEIARLVEQLLPDEVQLNTPLRPCAVKPLPPEEMSNIKQAFSMFKSVSTVYDGSRPDAAPLNLEETRRRRPGE
jgi:wyosine [tRNA(Phe)-imidazoG37] synthetase (radical SAM superfamily)